MIFEFDGQTWDTDKPVFVVGRGGSRDDWSPFSKILADSSEYFYERYGLKCRKMYIHAIYFHFLNGTNVASGFECEWKKRPDYHVSEKNHYMSHKRDIAVESFLNSMKRT